MASSREDLLLEIFEKKIPDFYDTSEVRTTQIQMAIDVAAFLHARQRDKKILILEAPVGTGKSLGALVPSLVECSMDRIFSSQRIVYATATINLQGQLMNGEVPLLKKLNLLNKAILAKGKSHYYCHNEMKKSYIQDNDLIDKMTRFYSNGFTGQRDEFESEFSEVPNSIWERVNLKASKRECERCNYSQTCPSFQHRNGFLKENDLVITNHEQLIRSALNRLQENPFPPIVPVDPGIIIIDEAHHFLENYLSQLEDTITIRELKSISNSNRLPDRYRRPLKHKVDQLEKKLKIEAESCESLQGRYPIPQFAHSLLQDIQSFLVGALDDLVIKNQRRGVFLSESEDEFSDKLESIERSIENLLNEKRNVGWVTYEELALSSIPSNFPHRFKELIDFLTKQNKIVVMSGTLTTNEDFSSFLAQWRLSINEVDVKLIPQSFQYEKQSLIYVPPNVLDPRQQDEDWIQNQLLHYKELLQLTQGRTLILSTSKQHMMNVAAELQDICTNLGVTFLRQEQGGVEQLTKTFKNDETSVLLGSGSFFSGFSVSGASLVSVIFSRLPFPVPDDPYLKLIGAGLEDVFMEEVILPNMMTKLNQGVGRLIRDIQDYGIITILDSRVFDSAYGGIIQKDFESKGYRFTRSLEEAQQFYLQKLNKGSEAAYTTYDRSQLTIPDSLKDIGVEVEKKVVKEKVERPKKYKITEEQHAFALKICKERGVHLSSKPKFGEDLYKFLVDLYYVTYSSIAPVKDHFPFKNEVQRENLEVYGGEGTRTYQMKKCTHPAFGCSGICNGEFKALLNDRVENCGGNVDSYVESKGFCWLVIKPFDKNDAIMDMYQAITEAAAGGSS